MTGAEKVARWHLRRQVPDAQFRERLTPRYTAGCKRILVSDDFYPALTRSNVELVTDGVAEVRQRSLVTTSGRELPVDTIIFGTGFSATDAPIAARIEAATGALSPSTGGRACRRTSGCSSPAFPTSSS